jgi:polyhydroxyalkanoate synthesis regulator phasin
MASPSIKPTKRLLAGGAAALGAGLLAVGPLRAAAQDDGDDGDGWVDSALDGLVDDGTITQAQADAVADALQEARPDHFPGFGPWGPGGLFAVGVEVLDETADAIGISNDELLDALRDGQTIAEVAESEGVDPQTVIDALVAATRERLDEAVADGRVEQEDADERLADVTERITEFVNEGAAKFRERFPRPGPDEGWFEDRWEHRGPFDWDDEKTEDSSPNDSAPDTTSPDTTSPDTTSPDTSDPGGS